MRLGEFVVFKWKKSRTGQVELDKAEQNGVD